MIYQLLSGHAAWWKAFCHTNLVEWLEWCKRCANCWTISNSPFAHWPSGVRETIQPAHWQPPLPIWHDLKRHQHAHHAPASFNPLTIHSGRSFSKRGWIVTSAKIRSIFYHFLYRDLHPNSRRSTWACKPGSTSKIFRICLSMPFVFWNLRCQLPVGDTSCISHHISTNVMQKIHQLHISSPTSTCGEETDEPYTSRDVTQWACWSSQLQCHSQVPDRPIASGECSWFSSLLRHKKPGAMRTLNDFINFKQDYTQQLQWKSQVMKKLLRFVSLHDSVSYAPTWA